MSAGAFETVVLACGDTKVAVVPARGGIVSALTLGARDVLYMDAATLADTTKNVRGGIPLLFPFAGRLPDDLLRASGGTRMKQHGFGRNLPWAVVDVARDAVTLALADDEATRAAFPWSFRAEARVRALTNGVHVELAVTHAADDARAAEPMPLAPGWHPYFACAADAKATLSAAVAGLEAGIVDDQREHDLGVVAPADGVVPLTIEGRALTLSFSPAMRHVQVWTLPGKPFVCVEPFHGPAGTIDDATARAELAPGQTRTWWMRIEALDSDDAAIAEAA